MTLQLQISSLAFSTAGTRSLVPAVFTGLGTFFGLVPVQTVQNGGYGYVLTGVQSISYPYSQLYFDTRNGLR